MGKDPVNGFAMPARVEVAVQSPGIADALATRMIPVIVPSEAEIAYALSVLHMTSETVECVYCGDPCSHWEHLHPIVADGLPTGYITEIKNLVPCCGTCCRSKGASDWKTWLASDAPLSPKSRGVKNVSARAAKIEEYEAKFIPSRIDIATVVGEELWESYCQSRAELLAVMQSGGPTFGQIAARLGEHCAQLDTSLELPKEEPRQNTGVKTATRPSAKKKQQAKGAPQAGRVSDVVKSYLIPLLATGYVDPTTMEQMQDLEFCKETFGIRLPLLKKLAEGENPSVAAKDAKGHGRYYVTPVTVRGESYLICSQWYANNKLRLMQWLSEWRPSES